jgi:hypothetical protein
MRWLRHRQGFVAPGRYGMSRGGICATVRVTAMLAITRRTAADLAWLLASLGMIVSAILLTF